MTKTNTPESSEVNTEENSEIDKLIKGEASANKIAEEVLSKKESGDKPEINLDEYVPKNQYEEIEQKIGGQEKELGEYRSFFKEISPLLDKLQEQPDLVEAIMEGKIDSKLAESVMAGKFKIEDATEVAEAHKEIKKELGTKQYKEMSPEDIEKLVEERVTEHIEKAEKNLKTNFTSIEDRKEFESKVNSFIANTPDFPEFSEAVVNWLEEHPEQYEIEIAYDAVKGKALANLAKEEEDAKMGEAQKDLIRNAGGGSSQGNKIVENTNIIDSLIRNRSNPNVL